MPTITVPSGSSASVSLTFASTSSASLASGLLASVYTAAAANTLTVYPQPTVGGATNEFVVTVPGAVTVPAEYGVIVDAVTSGTVTITGNGASNETVIVGGSNLVYNPTGGSGTIVAGGGNDTFANPAYQTGSGYTVLGDGLFIDSGVTTLVETIVNTGTYSYNNVPSQFYTSYLIANTAPGPSTVNLNANAETVNALSNGGVYNDNGGLIFINGGANTVVASASAQLAQIYGGNYNMLVTQGADTARVIFVNGSGNSSITAGPAGGVLAYDGAGGTINLSDTSSAATYPGAVSVSGSQASANTYPPVASSATSAFNYLIGVTGAETLNAAASSNTAVLVAGQANVYAVLGNVATDAFFAGSGASTVVGGTGSGSALPDLYAFSNGASGGSDLILNWGTASGLVFLGYGAAGDAAIRAAIAAAPTNGATVSITLPDSTQITVTGLNGAAVNLGNNPIYLT